jgi:hypothetical protein
MNLNETDAIIEKLSREDKRLAHVYLDFVGEAYIEHSLATNEYKLVRSVDVIHIIKQDPGDPQCQK